MNTNSIDRLGELKAKIADLQAEADKISDELRSRGKGSYEGSLFKVTVSEETTTSTFDTTKAKEKLLKLGVSQSWIDRNVKTSVRKGSVTVRAR